MNHDKWKQGSFGCAEQDTVGIKLESFSDTKLHCSDFRTNGNRVHSVMLGRIM